MRQTILIVLATLLLYGCTTSTQQPPTSEEVREMENLLKATMTEGWSMSVIGNVNAPYRWTPSRRFKGVTFQLVVDESKWQEWREGHPYRKPVKPEVSITFMPGGYNGEHISKQPHGIQVALFNAKYLGIWKRFKVFGCRNFGYSLEDSTLDPFWPSVHEKICHALGLSYEGAEKLASTVGGEWGKLSTGVECQITIDRQKYNLDEPITITVTMKNNHPDRYLMAPVLYQKEESHKYAVTLPLANVLIVQDISGKPVEKLDILLEHSALCAGVAIDPNEQRSFRVNLKDIYVLQRPGKYSVMLAFTKESTSNFVEGNSNKLIFEVMRMER